MNPTFISSRITNILHEYFDGKIDMSDKAKHPENECEKIFLARALAALCIKVLSGVDNTIAGASVTDDFKDGGIDALYFDQDNDTLLIVQSTCSQKGFGAVDCGSFIDGVKDLLVPKFERFNDKIKAKEGEVRAALTALRNIKIILVTAQLAEQSIPDFVTTKIEEFIGEQNKIEQVALAKYYNQAGIHSLITSESKPKKITLPIYLKDFGLIENPYPAYYGKVSVLNIAEWWRDYGNALCKSNIRHFIKKSEVNNALEKTLANEPYNFWYFNNGVTIICESIHKTLSGSGSREIGLFNCDGVSIVNGAQTVGTIGELLAGSDLQSKDNPFIQSWVNLRIISLERCPQDFEKNITYATNLQNAVGNLDFAAMDPIHHRLAIDFALDHRIYSYKSGDEDPRGNEGCGIKEAAQALGCAYSVELAVLVKRNVGSIFEEITKPPYTNIFNNDLTSIRLWKAVKTMRTVNYHLTKLRLLHGLSRCEMIGIHLNCIILHLVFKDPEVSRLYNSLTYDENELTEKVQRATERVFLIVIEYIESHHANEYMANFSKNTAKCNILVDAILSPPAPSPPHPVWDLFNKAETVE